MFSKDYEKLLKIILPHTDKPTLIVLVLTNSILEYGDPSDDCLIALSRCLTKLSSESERNGKPHIGPKPTKE